MARKKTNRSSTASSTKKSITPKSKTKSKKLNTSIQQSALTRSKEKNATSRKSEESAEQAANISKPADHRNTRVTRKNSKSSPVVQLSTTPDVIASPCSSKSTIYNLRRTSREKNSPPISTSTFVQTPMFTEVSSKTFELPETVINCILEPAKSEEAFDKLLSSQHESPPWTKQPIRTYSSKKKPIETSTKLLEFADCKNKDAIVKWLNDNRNFFDCVILTQTQNSELDGDCDIPFDLPSVSQAPPKIEEKRMRTRSFSANKTRARSLDILITKNFNSGRIKSHSVAGDTPDIDNYHIDDVNTEDEVPEENTKALLNLMEDEYLNNIEREMMEGGIQADLQTKEKMHSGWDRIKDIKKTINTVKKQPKQLNIILNSEHSKTAQDSSKNDNNNTSKPVITIEAEDEVVNTHSQSAKYPTYNLSQIEKYIEENIYRVAVQPPSLNNSSCHTNNEISTDYPDESGTSFHMHKSDPVPTELIVNEGDTVLQHLRLLVLRDNKKGLDVLQTFSAKIKTILDEFGYNLNHHAQVQTSPPSEASKEVQAEQISTVRTEISVQTEPVCQMEVAIQTQIIDQDIYVQTEPVCHKEVAIQTEIVDQENEEEPTSKGSLETLDLVYFDTEELYEKSVQKNNHKNELSQPQIEPVNDDDIIYFGTPDVFEDDAAPKTNTNDDIVVVNTEEVSKSSKNDEKELLPSSERRDKDSVSSALFCSVQSRKLGNDDVLTGVKRTAPSVFNDELEEPPNKRPCQKFMRNDMSIEIESCPQSSYREREEGQVLEDNANNDDYLEQIMNKYDSQLEPQKKINDKPSRTQQLIQECNNLIYQATNRKSTPQIVAGREVEKQKSLETQGSDDSIFNNEACLNKMEDDIDNYAKNISNTIANTETVYSTSKKTRRNLFSPGPSKSPHDKYSESIFVQDQDVTITKNNIDSILKQINRSGENPDEERNFDDEVQSIISSGENKRIKILQNIVLKTRNSEHSCNDDGANSDSTSSDIDIVESTPQKDGSCFNKGRKNEASLTDIILPPPLEFQGESSAKENFSLEDITVIDTQNVRSLTKTQPQPRAPVGVLQPLPVSSPAPNPDRVTYHSTPHSQKQHSEVISLSPIPVENKGRSVMGLLELAQSVRFTPLTIIKKPSPQSQHTPRTKQKSILSYLGPSQEKRHVGQSSGRLPAHKPCIASTRISREQIIAISSLTNKKFATYSSTFTSKVTHMIVNVNDKNRVNDYTMKFVLAVASGIWVLNFKWVQECLSRNEIVPEEPYEVLDNGGVDGPKQARLNRTTNPLFKGYRFYAAPPFPSTTREDVETVIKLLGGVVVPAPEDLLDKNGFVSVIIAEASATQDFEIFETWLKVLKVATVDIEWLSRSVGQYKLFSLFPYALCSDDSLANLNYPSELVVNVPFFSSESTLQ